MAVEEDAATRPSSAEVVALRLTVNGVPRLLVVGAGRRLLGVLRDDLGLTGAKAGCEVGVCGTCTVLVNGNPTSSCIMLAAQADGAEITTVEGLERIPEVRRVQEEFITEGGFQCGYCTSGQLMTAASLIMSGALDEMSDVDVRETMLGNLCRCTGYYGILRAIEAART